MSAQRIDDKRLDALISYHEADAACGGVREVCEAETSLALDLRDARERLGRLELLAYSALTFYLAAQDSGGYYDCEDSTGFDDAVEGFMLNEFGVAARERKAT